MDMDDLLVPPQVVSAAGGGGLLRKGARGGGGGGGDKQQSLAGKKTEAPLIVHESFDWEVREARITDQAGCTSRTRLGAHRDLQQAPPGGV